MIPDNMITHIIYIEILISFPKLMGVKLKGIKVVRSHAATHFQQFMKYVLKIISLFW